MSEDHCCADGLQTHNLYHTSTCRIWDVDRPAPPPTGPEDDIGQGEGCEGGKCKVEEKK